MKRLVLRTVFPALLAIGLFSAVVFSYFLPATSRAVMDQKRLMIRELTESPWNIMARFAAEEQSGQLTGEAARAEAIGQIRSLHYGQEGKDYFFVIDSHPRMIVHPYRPDLEGQPLVDFADPLGKRLFVEMVDVVERDGAGYVSYMWQWKDDPGRIVPKLTYVKRFEPWGWIIGTGVYTDDVDAEISALNDDLRTAALLILLVVSVLMAGLLRESFHAEQGRRKATAALRASEEKYRSLVESAGESIFMSIAGEGLFANASMLRLVGYEHDELAQLDVAEIVRPTPAELESGRRHWQAIVDGSEAPRRYEAELVAKGGSTVQVLLALSRVVLQGRTGFMAVATQLAQPRELDLEATASSDELAAANREMTTMASLMMSHGADAMQVSRMLSTNADQTVRRAVEFAIADLGAPPAEFEVLLMGSLGRAEVSLLADQDHAIVYADDAPVDGAREYFLALGKRLADILNAAGYAYCPGGIMASEPDCCQSLAGWKESFAGWIHQLEPVDLLKVKIFFDFRCAFGAGHLADELRAHVLAEMHSEPRFLHLLARSVLEYEPPLNAFGGFVLEEGESTRETFDVKGVLAQVVDWARLRTLQHGLVATSTLERIAALAEAEHIRSDTAEETAAAFRYLMDLRMVHQAREILARLEPDNDIEPEALDQAGRRQLKAAFSHLKALQAALDLEFKGA